MGEDDYVNSPQLDATDTTPTITNQMPTQTTYNDLTSRRSLGKRSRMALSSRAKSAGRRTNKREHREY